MRFRRRLAAYRRLTQPDRRLARGALVMLLYSRLALLVYSVDEWRDRLRARADRLRLPPVPSADAQIAASRTAAIVLSVARAIRPTPSCLHRSLVVEALLVARGVSVQVRYGVRREGRQLQAHSWVEHERIALTPPGDEAGAYVPMQVV